MNRVQLGTSPFRASRLAYGCWRIAGSPNPGETTAQSKAAGRSAILAAYESGYTLFDHADIYCDGEAERIFGQVLKEVSGLRDQILIASKCGIRKSNDPYPGAPYRYDFSAQYIIQSCEESLKRLSVETLDLYQLHRPDYLMEPEEVAGAFAHLKRAGMVREFGISNFRPSQVAALQKACPMHLQANQVEISLANLSCFQDGTLDQCLAEHISPMAWSPLAGGLLGNHVHRILPAQETYHTNVVVTLLDELAGAAGVGRAVVALAWLLRHPARIIPIVGSTQPESIRAAAKADEFNLSREDWYRLLEAAYGKRLR